jgi:hypothetical protein
LNPLIFKITLTRYLYPVGVIICFQHRKQKGKIESEFNIAPHKEQDAYFDGVIK